MKPNLLLPSILAATGMSLCSSSAFGQAKVLWESYNDYRPGDQTSENATSYDLRLQDDGGILKDFATGKDLKASVIASVDPPEATPDDFGAVTAATAGTPAVLFFENKITLGNEGLPGVRWNDTTQVTLILTFNGLDPTKRYNFRGTVSRGGGYNNRWSVFTLNSTSAFVDAHVDGSKNKNIITKTTYPAATLEANQVALNSGDNKAGSLVGWDNIETGADGEFSISATQYVGKTPFGSPTVDPYAYGFNATYLAEVESTGNLRLTANPISLAAPAGKTASFAVAGNSPAAIIYQWQKAPAGSNTFADIAGATLATYTTPVLVVADNGAKFRCNLTSGGNKATSNEATLTVDGVIPVLSAATGSINLNAVHITFSEPMKLDLLADKANYALDGGLTITSATAIDPVTVRLLTSKHTSATKYNVTINKLEDVAGNSIAANSKKEFAGFGVAAGVVGIEIWRNIVGDPVQSLLDDLRYPNEPDFDGNAAAFDSNLYYPDGPNNTYGGRIRAWLTPTETASYEFFILADTTGSLWISTDDKFENLGVDPLATHDITDPSVAVPLEKGKRYAIQALWKESNGNDFCRVYWRKVGDTKIPPDELTPIPSQFLSFYGPGGSAVVDPPAAEGQITKIAKSGAAVTLEWTGAGPLQSSDDMKTWKDEAAAKSPLSITLATAKKFYRVKK